MKHSLDLMAKAATGFVTLVVALALAACGTASFKRATSEASFCMDMGVSCR